MATPVALTSERASLLLLLSPKYVTMDITGAASAKTSKCFLILFRSRPACIKKETSPKAAGALCSIIATNTINWTLVCEVEAAAPKATPSAAAWTTRPSVVVILELLGLAVSGSEVKISKSAMKQCEIETVRTLTRR